MIKESSTFLQKIFPQFSSPSQSRFLKFFQELTIQQKLEETRIIYKSLDINTEDILTGHDKRTSIIIKGFPSIMSTNQVLSLLQNFCNCINFFYIPSCIKEHKKYMYAFINVDNYQSLIPLYNGLQFLRDKCKNIIGFDLTELEWYYSKTQGQKALMKKCYGFKE